MNEITLTTSSIPQALPSISVSIRLATMNDIPFIDGLQKLHTKQVGWMPTAQFEGKIKLGHISIAEDDAKVPVGYCIGNDQYFKRDDLGIIYQLNVAPGKQRGFIGATLLKAMFDRAAYGCKLFCCWCAQDIEANRFWEACGFVPLAFRAGSRTKGAGGKPRVHIFWQKRIREGDTTTAWWFPSQTSGGSIREDRLVFPIPPGVRWSDAKPIVLPGAEEPKQITARKPKARREIAGPPVPKGAGAGGLRYFVAHEPPKAEKEKPQRKLKQKNDPKYVAAARELRDRYLEEVNRDGGLLPSGKYDVARQITATVDAPKHLPLAA